MDGTATTSISAALPAVTPGLTAKYTTIKKKKYIQHQRKQIYY
jgi:hypothetical protein